MSFTKSTRLLLSLSRSVVWHIPIECFGHRNPRLCFRVGSLTLLIFRGLHFAILYACSSWVSRMLIVERIKLLRLCHLKSLPDPQFSQGSWAPTRDSLNRLQEVKTTQGGSNHMRRVQKCSFIFCMSFNLTGHWHQNPDQAPFDSHQNQKISDFDHLEDLRSVLLQKSAHFMVDRPTLWCWAGFLAESCHGASTFH